MVLSTIARTSFLPADVGVNELRFRSESAQLINERLAGLITPTGNDHLRALLGEGNGGGAPDARKGSRNQDNRILHDNSFTSASSPTLVIAGFAGHPIRDRRQAGYGVGLKMNTPKGLKNGPQFQTYRTRLSEMALWGWTAFDGSRHAKSVPLAL
jgi:hypothetical protein